MDHLRQDAERIYTSAIGASVPDEAVRRYLADFCPGKGRLILIAVGKAAWAMANAAVEALGDRELTGLVLTKYGHAGKPLPGLELLEAGHPVPDENTFAGTRRAIQLVTGLTREDTVLFLLSGGGSTLFEQSELPLEELRQINRQLLACGADIREINTVRKRLSQVKGGRFAALASPARVVSVILSDVLGDRVDMIASGPTCLDTSTCREAAEIVKKYGLCLSAQARDLLKRETPRSLTNAEHHICGSVGLLCRAAVKTCRDLGYETTLLTENLNTYARDAGHFLGKLAREQAETGKKLAFVAGGETVVRLTGTGLGGRNQELALAAAEDIAGLEGTCVFSVGSDGTDGPTDAAGGYVDGGTASRLEALGISIPAVLRDNDSYHALEKAEGLIFTGATGTNVNDLSVVLIRP